jgi:glycosyltransferase involved in cell wall biosynthesis
MSRAHHLLRRLAEHCDLYMFCFAANASESQVDPLLDYAAQLVLVQPRPGSIPDWRNPQTGLIGYRTLAMRRHLEVLIEDWKIPLLEVEGAQLAIAGSWLRRTAAATILAAPELSFARGGQARMGAALGASTAARREAASWRRYELRHLRQFDCVVTASAPDREFLEKQTSHPRVRVVENGVDLDHFRNETPDPVEEHVLWIAEFEKSLNLTVFRDLMEEVWPRIREARPGAKLTVVAGADYRLHWRRHFRRSLTETPPDVTVLGHVGDLRTLYLRAAVVIAPAPGGGASGHILEALAMSRAVVAARDACSGLGLEEERHFLPAETAGQFAAAIVKLLSDEGLRQRLGREGRTLVEARFDWDRSAAQQLAIYEELLRGRNGPK